jgi:hypothetical protein
VTEQHARGVPARLRVPQMPDAYVERSLTGAFDRAAAQERLSHPESAMLLVLDRP